MSEAPDDALQRLAKTGYSLPDFLRAARTPDGGMVTYRVGHSVPRRGMPYPEAVIANNQVKKLTVAMFASLAGLRKGITGFLNEYLWNYCRLTETVYGQCDYVPILNREYYCPASKGAWTLLSTFLWEIGVRRDYVHHLDDSTREIDTVANRTGQMLATILEYDDFYKCVLIDVMSEFTKDEIIKSPQAFVRKAVDIIAERSDNDLLKIKLSKFIFLAKLFLWLPKYRRAFRKAFEAVDMKSLQWDEYELYWNLPRNGYAIQGRPLKERMEDFTAQVNAFVKEKIRTGEYKVISEQEANDLSKRQ